VERGSLTSRAREGVADAGGKHDTGHDNGKNDWSYFEDARDDATRAILVFLAEPVARVGQCVEVRDQAHDELETDKVVDVCRQFATVVAGDDDEREGSDTLLFVEGIGEPFENVDGAQG